MATEDKKKSGRPDTQIGATFDPEEAREIRAIKNAEDCNWKQAIDIFYKRKFGKPMGDVQPVVQPKPDVVVKEIPAQKVDTDSIRRELELKLRDELDKRFPKTDPPKTPEPRVDEMDRAERVAKMLREEREAALKEGKSKDEADRRITELEERLSKKLDSIGTPEKKEPALSADSIAAALDKAIDKKLDGKVPAAPASATTQDKYKNEYDEAVHTELMKKIKGEQRSNPFDADTIGALGSVASSISEDITRFLEKKAGQSSLQQDLMALGNFYAYVKNNGGSMSTPELIDLVRNLKGVAGAQPAPEPAKRREVDEVLDDVERGMRGESTDEPKQKTGKKGR